MAGERARSGRSTRRKGRAAREVSIQGILSGSEPDDRNTAHPSLGARCLAIPLGIRQKPREPTRTNVNDLDLEKLMLLELPGRVLRS